MTLGTAGGPAVAAPAAVAGKRAEDGFGLHIAERGEKDPRMWFYRFATDAIGWNPGVNVLLPEGYHEGNRTYPVLYLLHGGGGKFTDWENLDIRGITRGKPLIVVMPDGGTAGWYSDPVHSNSGPRNWETFHIGQLRPWIDANFRTHDAAEGRAVAGFSMGGFGALKYAVRHGGLFASVSAHSGPPSLRRDAGIVTHWANVSSGAVELAGGTVYGVPWDEARVSADNPMEHIGSFRDKRIFLVAGTSPNPIEPFDLLNETEVLRGQREFKDALDRAAVRYTAHEVSGGHFVRPDLLAEDIDGVVGRLRAAG